MKLALVRRPGPHLAEGLLTHRTRLPVDLDLARRQWRGYVDALRGEGWETIEVAPADDCPDAAFVEDTVVVYGDLAVIARPGAEARRPETAGTEEALASLGYRIARIEPPGTLDGGDVLEHAGMVWVGLGDRTNASGMEQLAALLEPLGAQVVGVPVSRVLHLKSAVTALPDGTVVGFEPLVDDPTVWPSFLQVPEEAGAHVVVLDGSTVLLSTSAPVTRALFESRGLRVVAVDISEYEKLEGCVTCLSVRLRVAGGGAPVNRRAGIVVAVVGGDGVGKTTLATSLVAALHAKGHTARLVRRWDILDRDRFPEAAFLLGAPTEIRERAVNLPPRARFLFLMWTVALALDGGGGGDGADFVVADGYWLKAAASEVAYGLDPEWALAVGRGLPRADLVLRLKLPVAAAWVRKSGELWRYECGLDPHCTQRSFLDHQQRIQAVLDQWCEGAGWQEIDASLPPHDIVDLALGHTLAAALT